ncbi:hypothetical protein ARMSODRAFT_1068405 [Armillaria solidipes]|uniref:Uncharacterized protein n=1 Tax=Armillaria solidipes TaxID=1076256 RepID=A0A2H3B7K6_9AGAR|nr:hypothetical protein ARMSODRAFT_1068405 [Armillaria solidipes]
MSILLFETASISYSLSSVSNKQIYASPLKLKLNQSAASSHHSGYVPCSSTPRQQPPGGVIPKDATPYCFMLKVHSCRSCLQFSISHGFHFDNFAGNITAGIPITLSWHRNVNDPNQINFVLCNSTGPFVFLDAHSFSATNLTQLSGTLNVTFPESGEHVIETTINQTTVPASTQRFDVARPSEHVVPSGSVNPSASSVTETGQPPSSSTGSVQGTATDSPNSNSTHQTRRTSTIIGAVIGSLMSLLLLFGGGTFLFIRKRRERSLKHRLSPNLKILPELNLDSPPVRSKNDETISPMPVGEITPDVGGRSQEPIEGNLEGNSTEERRNRIGTAAHNDTSERPSPREENLQTPLDDVGAEVLRLRDQVQRLVERVQGNVFDPPPAYA